MPRLSLWNDGRKGATYNFIDRAVSEYFGISGTAVHLHKYLGHHEQDAGATGDLPNESSIQDVLFLENRDRRYSEEVFELRGIYNVNDVDADLRQFGLFLQNDTLFIEVHMNDIIEMLGRKPMSGDVVELPHLRDDALLDPEAGAINKFYVVDDVNRASDGYSPTWYPHVLRLKCNPMQGAEEYSDILDKQAKDPFGFDDGVLRDLLTTAGTEMGINEEIVEAAKANVSGRNFETRHFYVVPGDELDGQNPWIFAGDGDPPNGAELVGAGVSFPDTPTEGDYYLRIDYSPQALFRHSGGVWRMQELDYREAEWSAAHRLLKKFINNNATETHEDGTVAPIRTGLHRAVKPRSDLD
jgi:hypothetical protein